MDDFSVFLDTDVVISALLSSQGASYAVVYGQKNYTCTISTVSRLEIERVADRLQIDTSPLMELFSLMRIQTLEESLAELKDRYRMFVHDDTDAHIVAGAIQSGCSFLLTYNVRDFRTETPFKKNGIKVMTPGLFLQYLRSKA